MSWRQTITPSQPNKETPLVEMLRGVEWASLLSNNPAATSGLTFGVNGGVMLVDGVLTTISDQTTLLDASSTCYVEATRAGVISDNTTGFTAGKMPLFVVTTSASGVTSFVDWRTWQGLPGIHGRASVAVTSADVTLSAAQARCDIINITGALTGDCNLIVPDGPQMWTVTNNTSGAHTLTVKTAAGTGVAITQGKAAAVLADGTNVILSNNDAAAIGGTLLAANNLSDLASAATARTNLGLGTSAVLDVDTDGTLAANSDTAISSQKAVKAYVDNSVTGLWDVKGGTDCSANPNYPSALKGDAYVVTVAGKIGGASGASVDVGDVFVALLDNAGGTEASVGTSWFHIEHNLVGVALLASPAFTGNPTAPTQSAADNSTKLATTAYVDAAVTSGSGAGLGTVNVFTKNQSVAPVALTDAATIATDASLSNNFTLTMVTTGRVMGAPTNATDGMVCNWAIDSGAGGFAMTWASAFDFGGAGAPTHSTTASKVDLVSGYYHAGTSKWLVSFRKGS